jgi:hypothetical protein
MDDPLLSSLLSYYLHWCCLQIAAPIPDGTAKRHFKIFHFFKCNHAKVNFVPTIRIFVLHRESTSKVTGLQWNNLVPWILDKTCQQPYRRYLSPKFMNCSVESASLSTNEDRIVGQKINVIKKLRELKKKLLDIKFLWEQRDFLDFLFTLLTSNKKR